MFIAGVLLSSACGKQDDSSSGIPAADYALPDPNNYKSGPCGSNVVSDLGSVRWNCMIFSTQKQIDNCKVTIVEFKSKYPGINCQVSQVSTQSGLEKEKTVTINEKWVNDLLAAFYQG